MQALNKGKITQIMTALLLLTLMTGCAEWNSVPVVVDQNFGNAYHAMVKNQTLCPEHGSTAKDPTMCPEHSPVTAMDGQKAQTVINAYRAPASEKLDQAKKGVAFDVKNVGGSTGN